MKDAVKGKRKKGDVEKVPVTLKVQAHFKKDKKEELVTDEEVLIEVRSFQTEPARVWGSYGTTVNLGNYESARIDVGCSVPCYVEEMDAAWDFAFDKCAERVKEETKKLKEYAQKRNNSPQ